MTSRLRIILSRYRRRIELTSRPDTVRGEVNGIGSFIAYLEKHYPDLRSFARLRRRPHIERWLQLLASRDPPYASATRHRMINSVAKFFRRIAEFEPVGAPPAGLLDAQDLPKCDRHLPRALSPEVDLRLQAALRGDDHVLAKGLLLARLLGLRIGELMRLELDCLVEYPAGPVVRVPLGKLHQDRVVPVDDEVVRLIQAVRLARPKRRPTWDERSRRMMHYLFPNRKGHPVGKSMWRRKLLAVAAAAGISEHLWPHRLRHTFATSLLGQGVSLPCLMKLLGHRSVLMTMRYVQLTGQEVQRQSHAAAQKAKERYTELVVRPRGAGALPDAPLDALLEQLVARLDLLRRAEPAPARRKRLARVLERTLRLRARLLGALA